MTEQVEASKKLKIKLKADTLWRAGTTDPSKQLDLFKSKKPKPKK